MMKALTIHQPWASLIAVGAKRYETRGWATDYRGPIAIHAGKALNHIRGEFDNRFVSVVQHMLFPNNLYVDMWSNVAQLLPRGAVIAIAELVDCHLITREMDPTDLDEDICLRRPGDTDRDHCGCTYMTDARELLLGDWTPGRFAWELSNVRLLDKPIPARGQQGLWEWTPEEGNP
jgi:hypothetical protein